MIGKTLILGGTRGLGESIAKESIARGRKTVVVGRSVRKEFFAPRFRGIHFFRTDLSDLDFIASNVARLLERYGPFDWIFYVAGIWLNKPVAGCSSREILEMVNVHLLGLVESLRLIHQFMMSRRPAFVSALGYPYQLTVISSTSAYKRRENEAIYRMVQAGKAAFVRSIAEEICRDLPYSQVTLVEPGGMDTGFFGDGRSTAKYMKTDAVARIILDRIAEKVLSGFDEYRIERDDNGAPIIREGPALPEPPFIISPLR